MLSHFELFWFPSNSFKYCSWQNVVWDWDVWSNNILNRYEEIMKSPHVEYTAGGASQNAARACQWMLGQKFPHTVTYVGCVGNDENGKRLKAIAERDGVSVHYLITGPSSFSLSLSLSDSHSFSYTHTYINEFKISSTLRCTCAFLLTNRIYSLHFSLQIKNVLEHVLFWSVTKNELSSQIWARQIFTISNIWSLKKFKHW